MDMRELDKEEDLLDYADGGLHIFVYIVLSLCIHTN
jgi:hypothetical protein